MRGMRIAAAGVLMMAVHADAAWANNCVWTGGGANGNWGTTANWTMCGGGRPVTGDTVTLPAGASRPASTNNITGLTLDGIAITGLAAGDVPYDVTGQSIRLSGNVDVTTRAAFKVPIVLAATIRITNESPSSSVSHACSLGAISLNGFGLTFDTIGASTYVDAITGAGAVIKSGNGSLGVRGGSYTGATVIENGSLDVLGPGGLGAGGSGSGTFVGAGATVSFNEGGAVDEPFVLAGDGYLAGGALAVYIDDADAPLTVTGSITLTASAKIRMSRNGTLVLAGSVLSSSPDRILTLDGFRSTFVLSNPNSTCQRLNVSNSTLRLGAAGAISDAAGVQLLDPQTTLDLNGFSETVGGLNGAQGLVQLGAGTLTIASPIGANDAFGGQIQGAGRLVKAGAGTFRLAGAASNIYTGGTTVQAGQLQLAATGGDATGAGPVAIVGGELITEQPQQIADTAAVTLTAPGVWRVYAAETIGSLAGSGRYELFSSSFYQGALTVGANNTSTTFSGTASGTTTAPIGFTKIGSGTLTLTGVNGFASHWRSVAGALMINGSTSVASSFFLDGGVLGGSGRVGHLIGASGATGGTLSPGSSPARFTVTDAVIGGPVVIELAGLTAGAGYDQLQVLGALTLTNTASLQVHRTFPAPAGSQFTIIDNAVAMIGLFAGLPQGATLSIDDQDFRISYTGGSDGHDVVLTALEDPPALTYFLAEGATGGFFDEDVLIANPGRDEAPVEITFLKDTGEHVTVLRTLPAQSHALIHVDEIPGLESAVASTQVASLSGQALFVERSMFWDANYYAGHTGSAISHPSAEWFFAEGAQGYFDTYILIVNPNDTAADVTFTFLRENESPVVKTLPVGPGSRLTVGTGTFSELSTRTFGIRVHATRPIMAERSMYFGSLPGRLWGGGHESAGVAAASTQWYLAEGATGNFFDTFILLSNPQGTTAQVSVQYLLPSGETIVVSKTIAGNGRLTLNPEAEADPRLRNTTVSTVVTSDVAIVAERSMYWPGATIPWGEAHNSFGVTAASESWGLAEGRLGGRVPFSTYILLANPQTAPAEVEVQFLRDAGAPVVRTYTVPATGRYTIDVSAIEELRNSAFGASILVTNHTPIIVERSMYWDAGGIFWSGGTNATGIPWASEAVAAARRP